MDVVALAQHGVEHAVATLGTATTPVHVQKLFRLADDVVFCFDGDAAGRKRRVARARERAACAGRRQERAHSCSCPTARIRTISSAQRGKAAFEALVGRRYAAIRVPAGELRAQHPPTCAEGAGRARRQRPLAAAQDARSASWGGPASAAWRSSRAFPRPNSQGSACARAANGRPSPAEAQRVPRAHRGREAPAPARPAPSLVRSCCNACWSARGWRAALAVPHVRWRGVPRRSPSTPWSGIAGNEGTLPAPGLQAFAGTPHEDVLAAALAGGRRRGTTEDEALLDLRAGIAR